MRATSSLLVVAGGQPSSLSNLSNLNVRWTCSGEWSYQSNTLIPAVPVPPSAPPFTSLQVRGSNYQQSGLLVTSYETIRKYAKELKGSCDLLICDEAHRCDE